MKKFLSKVIFIISLLLVASGAIAQTLIPYTNGTKWGYMNKAKKNVLPCIYDDTAPFINDVAIASQGSKYGLINSKGLVITPFKYTRISFRDDGYYFLQTDEGRNAITEYADKNGTLIPGFPKAPVIKDRSGLSKTSIAKKGGD